MTHLGSLGVKRDLDAVEFDYFGEAIAANPGLTDLHYMDFMEQAAGMAVDDPAALRIVKDFARACLGTSFDVFWSTALAHGQTQAEVFEVLMSVLEAATARPTELPSGSSDGQQSTATSSEGDSSLQERLAGRPDLQLLVSKAQAAKAS